MNVHNVASERKTVFEGFERSCKLSECLKSKCFTVALDITAQHAPSILMGDINIKPPEAIYEVMRNRRKEHWPVKTGPEGDDVVITCGLSGSLHDIDLSRYVRPPHHALGIVCDISNAVLPQSVPPPLDLPPLPRSTHRCQKPWRHRRPHHQTRHGRRPSRSSRSWHTAPGALR